MIVRKVKVFTSGKDPKDAGLDLTEQCDKFLESDSSNRLISIHTNSNKYGWMLTIVYDSDRSDC